MKSTARFEKVSFGQFKKDWEQAFPEDAMDEEDLDDGFVAKVYDRIRLPERGSSKSAGYDFFIPMDCTFEEGSEMLIPTGIRCADMEDDEVLEIYPRSGLGTKYGFVPKNLTGIIDADYADSENEGHIFVKMVSEKSFNINHGTAFCQGILSTYKTTIDDSVEKGRNGGFGSTGE